MSSELFSLFWSSDGKRWHKDISRQPFDEDFQEALLRLTQGPAAQAGIVYEVRVVDSGDCIAFHWKEGEVLFPSKEDVRKSRKNPRRNPHFLVKDLPLALQRALASIGYGRKDIEVTPATTYQAAGSAGDGYRAITVAVNLGTGEMTRSTGAWGGPTPFDKRQADLDTAVRPMPINGAVIHATEGGRRPLWAQVSIHPAALPQQVEAAEELPLTVAFALVAICTLTSAGRRDAFERTRWASKGPKMGDFSAANPHVQEVVRRGWATVNKAGAVAATIEGKNMRKQAERLLESHSIYI